MNTSNGLDLVFQYFFTAGLAVGFGLVFSVGLAYVVYKELIAWRGRRRKKVYHIS